MQFIQGNIYHIYNRTNNEEALFRNEDNYLYLLKRYRFYLEDFFDTIAYCLMPTHFHFLVRVKNSFESKQSLMISRKISAWLNGYTQAFNRAHNRHGSLFQQKTKAIPIENETYLLNVVTYIHQNPLRCKLVEKPEDWKFSSHQDYIELRKGSLPKKEIILNNITLNDYLEYSKIYLKTITPEVWV